jgi:hypothetical protein
MSTLRSGERFAVQKVWSAQCDRRHNTCSRSRPNLLHLSLNAETHSAVMVEFITRARARVCVYVSITYVCMYVCT